MRNHHQKNPWKCNMKSEKNKQLCQMFFEGKSMTAKNKHFHLLLFFFIQMTSTIHSFISSQSLLPSYFTINTHRDTHWTTREHFVEHLVCKYVGNVQIVLEIFRTSTKRWRRFFFCCLLKYRFSMTAKRWIFHVNINLYAYLIGLTE